MRSGLGWSGVEGVGAGVEAKWVGVEVGGRVGFGLKFGIGWGLV